MRKLTKEVKNSHPPLPTSRILVSVHARLGTRMPHTCCVIALVWVGRMLDHALFGKCQTCFSYRYDITSHRGARRCVTTDFYLPSTATQSGEVTKGSCLNRFHTILHPHHKVLGSRNNSLTRINLYRHLSAFTVLNVHLLQPISTSSRLSSYTLERSTRYSKPSWRTRRSPSRRSPR